MSEQPDDGHGHSLADEITWTLKRCRVLFLYWTMPVAITSPTDVTPDDRTSSRAFALLLIVALTFAVRGEGDTGVVKVSFTVLAAGLAAILSILLNLASQWLKVVISDEEIVSTYTSIILVMALYVVFQTVFEGLGFDWYRILAQLTGPRAAPAILATFATYGLLTAKAKIVDGNSIRGIDALHGLAVTVCAGVIVWAISFASNDFFKWAIILISQPHA